MSIVISDTGRGLDASQRQQLFISFVAMAMNMFEKRLRGYRAIGYARDEAPLGLAPPREEPTIEWDEAVLRNIEEQDP